MAITGTEERRKNFIPQMAADIFWAVGNENESRDHRAVVADVDYHYQSASLFLCGQPPSRLTTQRRVLPR